MISEAQEVAASIWRARSSLEGNGLNATLPIRTKTDAEFVARHYLGDESATVISNVAAALFDLAKTKRVAK